MKAFLTFFVLGLFSSPAISSSFDEHRGSRHRRGAIHPFLGAGVVCTAQPLVRRPVLLPRRGYHGRRHHRGRYNRRRHYRRGGFQGRGLLQINAAARARQNCEISTRRACQVTHCRPLGRFGRF